MYRSITERIEFKKIEIFSERKNNGKLETIYKKILGRNYKKKKKYVSVTEKFCKTRKINKNFNKN